MRHTPHTINVLREAFAGLSPVAQAVLGAAHILAGASRTGACSCSELRGVFRMSEAEFEPIYTELYAASAAFKTSEDELETCMAHDLLLYAVGVPGRPRTKDWEKLKTDMFGEWFGDDAPYCMYCHATDVPLTLDHALPVSRGGSNHPNNFVAACHPCNSAKGNKTFTEFMAGHLR